MVGEVEYKRWFRAANWMGVEDDAGTISVPGEMHQVWIETNYMPELVAAVSNAYDDVRRVRLVVAGEGKAAAGGAGGGGGRVWTGGAEEAVVGG